MEPRIVNRDPKCFSGLVMVMQVNCHRFQMSSWPWQSLAKTNDTKTCFEDTPLTTCGWGLGSLATGLLWRLVRNVQMLLRGGSGPTLNFVYNGKKRLRDLATEFLYISARASTSLKSCSSSCSSSAFFSNFQNF